MKGMKGILTTFFLPQSKLGVPNSANCYYMTTATSWYTVGPWKGPLTMLQGRQEPILVSCRTKVNASALFLKTYEGL